MIMNIKNKLILILFFVMTSFLYGEENKFNRIEVLVNENIITNYDIVQRVKISAILGQLEINQDNYQQLMNTVVEDLVTESLKKSEIIEYDISFNKDEYQSHENRFYSNINWSKEELKEIFKLNNVNYDYLIEYIELELKWQKLIYGLYLRVTSVTEQEIKELINKNPNINEEIAKELILQKQLDIKSTKLLNDLRDEATIEYK